MTFVRSEGVTSRVTMGLHARARKLAPYEAWLRFGHRRARARYRDRLSGDIALDDVCRDLRARGVTQRRLADLETPYDAMIEAADRLCAELAAQPSGHGRVDPERILAEPELYRFLLSEPLLDLAEQYMGLPVRHFGVELKREVADGALQGPRQYHTDPEDENVLKIIVYLNDVDAGTGPFQCIDATDSAKVRQAMRASTLAGRWIGTEDLEQIVPSSRWITCLGPRLTANICDTARCVHRASPPLTKDRYSITFSYLSERPYFLWSSDAALQRKFHARWGDLLSARQRTALARTPH